jgi:hypothetical protein
VQPWGSSGVRAPLALPKNAARIRSKRSRGPRHRAAALRLRGRALDIGA